tara:strand:+ start:27509 stop:28081 length:573 start_codon:yes stop_codon:yes gene_type:complete
MDLSNQADVRKIVEGCVERNADYQQLLYKTLYGKMMVVCQRYASRPEDAKDLFQDGFIKVFDKIEKFNFNGSLEGWVRKIMVNNAIDYYRKNKNKFAMSETLVESQQIAENEESEGIFDDVNADLLLSFVQQLSPVYRAVFNLYVLDDYSHAEIAEELGVSEGTSKSNFSKAKKNLKQMVKTHLKKSERI